jgi:hypothetical protein
VLQYFPNDFPSFGFSYILDNIEDQILKQEVDHFYLSELAFAVKLALAKAQEKDSIF